MFAYPKILLIGPILGLAFALVPAKAMACAPAQGALQLDEADRCNAPEPADGRISADQIDAIIEWLAAHFGLPRSAERPAIVFESPARLTAMYLNGFAVRDRLPRRQSEAKTLLPDIVALYNDARGTIYLSEDWTGESEAQMSVLVHEMVHHLQSVAGLKYNCPGEREKLAYQAQSAWLNRSGRSLESEFEIDGLTLLVHSNCM